MAGIVLLTHCEEYDELVNTLSVISNLPTWTSAKTVTESGRRVDGGCVMLPQSIVKVFTNSHIRSTSQQAHTSHLNFVGFRKPLSQLNRYMLAEVLETRPVTPQLLLLGMMIP